MIDSGKYVYKINISFEVVEGLRANTRSNYDNMFITLVDVFICIIKDFV